jgi:hypothetical protein
MNNFGILTEQGYPIGQFGFKPISEETVKEFDKDDKEKNKEEKENVE